MAFVLSALVLTPKAKALFALARAPLPMAMLLMAFREVIAPAPRATEKSPSAFVPAPLGLPPMAMELRP